MNEYNSVMAFAPATVANVSCGFDIMGFAINGCGDRVRVSFADGRHADGRFTDINTTNTVSISGNYAHLIPVEREKNTAGVAVGAYLKATGNESLNIIIELEKNLPLGSGMGSSASSSVAAVYALNTLLGNLLTVKELIPFAMEGEKIACGTAHADNAAPSMLGGFVLIRSYNPLDIIQIVCPKDLYCAVIHPDIEVNTSDARRVLKRDVPMSDVIKQSANAAGLMTALLTSDYSLMSRSMCDLLAEPKRTMLIPGFDLAREAAMNAGALGCGISGSGPSVFAICKGIATAQKAAEAIAGSFYGSGLSSQRYISSLNAPGASIIEKS